MPYSLLIKTGPKRGQQTMLEDREIVLVGRGEMCDVRLDDPSASRVHCRILVDAGRILLTDAGSRWGTYVNGQRMTDCNLSTGDEIRIGETLLRLTISSGPLATTMAPVGSAQPCLGAAQESLRPQEEGVVVAEQSPLATAGDVGYRRQLVPETFEGQAFLRFKIRKHVATTVSGLVFQADDPQLNQRVAIKIFHPSFLAGESQRQRFLRAIRTMVGLRHENLVTLHAAGRHDGLCYMVSEFIDGPSAADVIRTWGIAGMLDWRRVLSIAIDIARALEFAKKQRIVHRSITPRNILIRNGDDRALLNDLLLSKALDDSPVSAITQPGEVIGDLSYLSPEQLGSGHPVDHRSDMYQLGTTLYALLSGRPPFESQSTTETIQQVLTAEPISPVRYQLAIPPMLEGIVLHLLSKRPVDRFASATELLQDLQSAERHLK